MHGIYDVSGNILLALDGSSFKLGNAAYELELYGSTIYIDASDGVSLSYVDGSLAARDIQIANLNDDVSSLNDDVSSFNIQVVNLNSDVSSLNNQVVNLNSDVSVLDASIISLDASISYLYYDGIQVIANNHPPVYVNSLDDLATYVNSLSSPTVGVIVTIPPGNFSTSNPISFQSGMNILFKGAGLGYTLTFGSGVTFNSFTEIERAKITGDIVFNAGIGLKDSLLNGNITHTAGDFNVTKCGITGDYTNLGTGKIVALNLEQTGKMSLTGTGDQMLMNVQIKANDSSVAVYSAGQLIASNLVVSNEGTGDCVNCDNGAGPTTPNLLDGIFCFSGGITCGTAVSVIGSIYGTLTGSAFVRLDT